MFHPAHPSRLSVAFTVFELFYISVNCWKLIVMHGKHIFLSFLKSPHDTEWVHFCKDGKFNLINDP